MIEEGIVAFSGWMTNFELLSSGWRAGLIVFGLVFGTATVAFMVSRVIAAMERKFIETRNIWDDAILHAIRLPLVFFIWLQGVYWAAEVAYYYSEADVFTANDALLEIGFIWVVSWAVLGLIKQIEQVLVSPVKMKKPMDYTTVNAISKLSRMVVIITVILIALQTLGYSISGVLAFGGVGGIAIGFAAKDLLANFFGGFIIHLDRPFKVGDWIRSPDRNIEGTVEQIGWRMCTIRTFDKRPLYVPNATFTTIAVENPSRMSHRRISETIGVRYEDIDRVSGIVSDIRSMLQNHDEIEARQTLIVNFLAFNHSTLDIMVYTFTKTSEWVKYHEVKQDVLLKISDIIIGHGAELAFPTQTLHVADSVKLKHLEHDFGRDQGRGDTANEAGERSLRDNHEEAVSQQKSVEKHYAKPR
ncbi:mechanosensitive ion channel protein MscS [Marinobacter psychrophilus]|jgi:MscS family membrane protein|uniref:Mechanosensitive ion channel protein MscS n=1 Tax=Marinobacter psychrophilus TaxID=330734 RepID=A0A0H4I2Q6_9GAMM|nr:mechanosensitive ion channel family protein [Marinobacter psychrophilus]AKO51935.1 mechanosensitive ion channel protein MscS [Marinobacter psychrophilus]